MLLYIHRFMWWLFACKSLEHISKKQYPYPGREQDDSPRDSQSVSAYGGTYSIDDVIRQLSSQTFCMYSVHMYITSRITHHTETTTKFFIKLFMYLYCVLVPFLITDTQQLIR